MPAAVLALGSSVAPGLRAGRGLKPLTQKIVLVAPSSSRPSGWEGIETGSLGIADDDCYVAPGLRAGRGLKPHACKTASVRDR